MLIKCEKNAIKKAQTRQIFIQILQTNRPM